MNSELAIHNLTEQVRLLTERVESLEAKFVGTESEVMQGYTFPVHGGLNDAEPVETEVCSDCNGTGVIWGDNGYTKPCPKHCAEPQTLGQAATAGCEWEDVKGEQTTHKCDRPPGM